MTQSAKKTLYASWIVLILAALAMCIRVLTISSIIPASFGMIRNMIHIGLLVSWWVFLRRRIIHVQVRRYLLTIAALMTVWILLKAINYSIGNADIKRYLWYFYYIPILFIPSVSLLISLSLNSAEDHKLPGWAALLYVPDVLLVLLVLTNDLHQRVFSFPAGTMTVQNYHHEFGYYIILGWIILCALISFSIMLAKCRILPGKPILVLPLVPLILSFVYTAAYISGVSWLLLLAGDMTVVHCLLTAASLEACILCGLIQSNIGYKELLSATTLPIQITDEDFSPKQISDAMQPPLSQNRLRQISADTVMFNENTLLKRHRLRKGWVFWKEDISELNQLHDELQLTRDELLETGNILSAENEQYEKILRLSEENRLYDLIETQTARQISTLRNLLSEIKKTEDYEEARHLLGQIIVIGTYIKRRNNLILVGAQNGMIAPRELQLCLNESTENLNLYGVKSKALVQGDKPLTTNLAAQIYDLFEAVVEAELHSLHSLLISVEIGAVIEVNLCILGKEPLRQLTEQFPGTEWTQDEDGLQYITQKIDKKDFWERKAFHGSN